MQTKMSGSYRRFKKNTINWADHINIYIYTKKTTVNEFFKCPLNIHQNREYTGS